MQISQSIFTITLLHSQRMPHTHLPVLRPYVRVELAEVHPVAHVAHNRSGGLAIACWIHIEYLLFEFNLLAIVQL